MRRELRRIHPAFLPAGTAPAVGLLLPAPLVHPSVPPHVLLRLLRLLRLLLLLLLAPVVLLVALSSRIPLLLLLLLTVTLVLLVVARLEALLLLLLLLLLLVVVDLVVASLRSLLGSVAGVEVVGGVAGLELCRHVLVTSGRVGRALARVLRLSQPALQNNSQFVCLVATSSLSHLVDLVSPGSLQERSRLAPDSLLVQSLSLPASLQVPKAPVPRELTAHPEVPVQRSDWVGHPPALAVLHLDPAHLRHGGVPAVHEAAAHEISSHGH